MRKLPPSGSHAKTASKGQGSDAGEMRSLSLSRSPRPQERGRPGRGQQGTLAQSRAAHPHVILHRRVAATPSGSSASDIVEGPGRRGWLPRRWSLLGARAAGPDCAHPEAAAGSPGRPAFPTPAEAAPRPPGGGSRARQQRVPGQGSCTLMPGPSVR